MTSQRTKAELVLVGCALIWGASFSIAKNGLQDVSPFVLVALRFSVAAIILSCFNFSLLLKTNKSTLICGGILGVLLFLIFATQTVGLQYTSASKSAFITGLSVIFTPILQLLIEHRPPKKGNVIGIILVLIGLYLLTSPKGSGINIGDVITLGCAIVAAFHIVYLDIATKKCNVTQLVTLQIVITTILATAVALLFEERHLEFSPQFIFSISYLAILATLVAVFVQARFQKYTTPTRTAVVFSIEPVFAAIFAYWVRSEIIGIVGIVGGGLIIVGLIISELSDVLFRSRTALEAEHYEKCV